MFKNSRSDVKKLSLFSLVSVCLQSVAMASVLGLSTVNIPPGLFLFPLLPPPSLLLPALGPLPIFKSLVQVLSSTLKACF